MAGCAEEEIQMLKQLMDVEFPKAYRDFLRVMGKSPRSIFGEYSLTFSDDYFTFDDATKLQHTLRLKLKENDLLDEQFPSSVIAIGLQLGEDIVFMESQPEVEDPVVKLYSFPETDVLALNDKFSEFIFKTVYYYKFPSEGFRKVVEDGDVC